MNYLFDDYTLKVIVDFCKISDKIPDSVKTNQDLKNKIKNYHRFKKCQNVLSEEEKDFFGSKSFLWIKDAYKNGNTIITMQLNGKFLHSFLCSGDIFVDILGKTDNIDDIVLDFNNDKDIEFSMFNSIEDYFEFLKVINHDEFVTFLEKYKKDKSND